MDQRFHPAKNKSSKFILLKHDYSTKLWCSKHAKMAASALFSASLLLILPFYFVKRASLDTRPWRICHFCFMLRAFLWYGNLLLTLCHHTGKRIGTNVTTLVTLIGTFHQIFRSFTTLFLIQNFVPTKFTSLDSELPLTHILLDAFLNQTCKRTSSTLWNSFWKISLSESVLAESGWNFFTRRMYWRRTRSWLLSGSSSRVL